MHSICSNGLVGWVMHWISPSDTRVCILFGSESPTGCNILHIIANLTMVPLMCKADTRVVDTVSCSSLSSRQLTKLLYLISWDWEQDVQDAARWWKQLCFCRFQLYTGWWIWTPPTLLLTCMWLGETSFLLRNTYWVTRYIRRNTLFYWGAGALGMSCYTCTDSSPCWRCGSVGRREQAGYCKRTGRCWGRGVG